MSTIELEIVRCHRQRWRLLVVSAVISLVFPREQACSLVFGIDAPRCHKGLVAPDLCLVGFPGPRVRSGPKRSWDLGRKGAAGVIEFVY